MTVFKIVLVLIFNSSIAFAQFIGNPINIKGKISYERDNTDSIFFSNPFGIDRSYFEKIPLSSGISNGNFTIETKLSYPQMYAISYKSERGIYPERVGTYFIDPSTVSITVDSIGDHSRVIGDTYREYKTRFIPFFLKEGFKCEQSFLNCRFMGKGDAFDAILLKYAKKYPDSYVALWFLIERFSLTGYSKTIYETIEYFSPKIKKGKPWRTLRYHFDEVQIRRNNEFPELRLKTEELNIMDLSVPKAKYTLVDFWFSNCRPCLESFPKLKDLYGKFHEKGFEIVGISIDRTEKIEKWRQRISERELPWPQYLDENGKMAEKNRVMDFPTTFLLDDKGIVVEKNIPLESLEKLLEKNLAL